jgi:DNA-binding NarL/FixJ family response regulator
MNRETGMPLRDLPATSVLLIDGNATDRKHFADQLKRRFQGYQILEATDREDGLAICRSRRIDCVVVTIELPDESGFKVLVDLIPIASRPNLAVVMLTNRLQRGLHEIAWQNGAYSCFVKRFMSAEDLDRAIQRAMAFVGPIPKEERHGSF